jgi:ATP-binding cassette subfamily C protein
VSDSFEAIKEIKVSGLQKEFIDLYSKFAKIFSKSQFWLEAISRLPRYFIEIVTFSLIMGFILSFIYVNNEITNILSLVTLYIFSAYRILPAFQNIYVVFSQLKFSKPVLISIHDDLTNFKITKKIFSEPVNFNHNISLKNVNFSFLNSKEPVLKDINLAITALSKIAIVGENGSGKSTLVKIILSLLHPSQGTLSVDNKIINENNCKFWRKIISFVPSKVFISKDTIINNITFGFEKERINKRLVEDVAEFFNIHNFIINELRHGYETIIGENGVHLSEGQYQCIGMARALYRQPQVLILDEATNSLDKIAEQKIIKKLLNLKNITLIQIAHRVEIFENYDHIFYLEKGKIKDNGNYTQLLNINKEFLEMTKKFK